MRRMIRIVLGIISACLWLNSAAVLADIKLKFGIYTSDKATDMVRQFRPVLNSLEQKLSGELGEPVTIRMKVSKSYDEGIDRLVDGEVDFARFGPASYVLAKQREPGISILANEKNRKIKAFSGVICSLEGSGIRHLADLKGKRFAFGNPNSTTGRYFSQLYLQQNGIRARDLAGYEYLGRHDKVADMVANGGFDAGAFKEGTLRKMEKKGVKYRVLSTFPNMEKPWLARAGMPENVRLALQACLLSLDDKQALKTMKRAGFKPGSDGDYDYARTAILRNPEFFQ